MSFCCRPPDPSDGKALVGCSEKFWTNIRDAELRVYAIWFDVLAGDDRVEVDDSLLMDARVLEFWDNDREVWPVVSSTGGIPRPDRQAACVGHLLPLRARGDMGRDSITSGKLRLDHHRQAGRSPEKYSADAFRRLKLDAGSPLPRPSTCCFPIVVCCRRTVFVLPEPNSPEQSVA